MMHLVLLQGRSTQGWGRGGGRCRDIGCQDSREIHTGEVFWRKGYWWYTRGPRRIKRGEEIASQNSSIEAMVKSENRETYHTIL
jgi:hypothetical protein